MVDFIRNLTEQANTNMEVRSQVELNGQPFSTFKQRIETIDPHVQAVVLSTQSIAGDKLIWGNPDYGIWGTGKWGAETDITSAVIATRIVPPNDSFREQFQGNYFVGTSTATVNTGYVVFGATSQQLVSNVLYYNATSVVDANISITTTSDISNFGLYLSNNAGSSWESASQGITHTFASATGEQVAYKIIGLASNLQLTRVQVEINP